MDIQEKVLKIWYKSAWKRFFYIITVEFGNFDPINQATCYLTFTVSFRQLNANLSVPFFLLFRGFGITSAFTSPFSERYFGYVPEQGMSHDIKKTLSSWPPWYRMRRK